MISNSSWRKVKIINEIIDQLHELGINKLTNHALQRPLVFLKEEESWVIGFYYIIMEMHCEY